MDAKILVLDDEENIRKILTAMLTSEGFSVLSARTVNDAREILRREPVQVVLSDLKLEREDGLALLRWVVAERLPIPFIILTAHGTVDSAVDSLKMGAFDYLAKPFEKNELIRVIGKAVKTYAFHSSQSIRTTHSERYPMIGKHALLMKVFQVIDKVASTESTIFITGESGTGKELIAQALHDRSTRHNGPFIKINCAAIPPTLMESELFGHERGAFTGAIAAKPGRFELADGGTLFLDEIGEMNIEMQVKLLRVLQDKCFERVGGVRTLKVDVRLVTATNRDLEADVRDGRFRNDLFYRLNVVPIHLPPLRERPDDIPLLVGFFVKKMAEQLKRAPCTVSPEALELLSQFPWPGNIRQLENAIERMVVMNETGAITPEELPDDVLEFEEKRFLLSQAAAGGSLKDRVKDATRVVETKMIEDALMKTSGNVTQAARHLNLSRKGLQLKMKELGLR
ncbi:MAG: sigma-54-dependent Fis family transcriptional regulator [Deltaproteobacteria bacterium]|nr:sigma-54-dependent Fis family transcriptional regulator [Deltaproteobacteria bacterium]